MQPAVIPAESRALSGVPRRASRARLLLATSMLAVVAVYAMPVIFFWARDGRVPPSFRSSETIYPVRIAALYRGEDLGNPYLAGHSDAPRYMPEMAERIVASTGRALHLPLLTILALVRIGTPLVIFALVFGVAAQLGLQTRAAVIAAAVTCLAPALSEFHPDAPGAAFLRYFRLVSPGMHVVFFLLVLLAVATCLKIPNWKSAALVAATVAIVFHQAVFYWSVACLGAALVALTFRRSRGGKWIAAGLAAGAAIGLPAVIHLMRLARVPEVHETLRRLGLMEGGHAIESGVPARLAIAGVAIAIAIIARRRLASRFALPFLVATAIMLVQNVVTGRMIQAYHLINVLIPVGALVIAAAADRIHVTRYAFALVVALTLASGWMHWHNSRKFVEYQLAKHPLAFAPDHTVPETLAFLREHTRPGSVVIGNADLMEELPIFTGNRVYWTWYAAQHVISDREWFYRSQDAAWTPRWGYLPHYHADYYVGVGEDCGGLAAVFRSDAEHTCVVKVEDLHLQPRKHELEM